MIVLGIAATADAPIGDHVLLAGAIDTTALPPLFVEHRHAVGRVLQLIDTGSGRVYATVETDDMAAAQLPGLSVAGRAIERERRDGLWRVSKFRLTEISLVRHPENPHCTVIERRAFDPLRELIKVRAREADLFAQVFLRLSATLRKAAACA